MFSIKKTKCFLGRALELSTSKLKLVVTLDVGPRIIWLSKENGENIMFNDVDDKISKDVSAIYGVGEVWHIYGGHRVWLSPECHATYYPDNSEVRYKVEDDIVTFIPPLCKITEIQIKLSVKYLEENKIEVGMQATNKGSGTKTLAVWGLTVLKPNAQMVIKNNTADSEYLPSFNVVHWGYNDLNDRRLQVANDQIVVNSFDDMPSALKIGTFNKNLQMTYKYNDTTFTKYAKADPDLKYPDFQCNFETYTNDLIHEAETLSPLVTLKWREKITHNEIWQID